MPRSRLHLQRAHQPGCRRAPTLPWFLPTSRLRLHQRYPHRRSRFRTKSSRAKGRRPTLHPRCGPTHSHHLPQRGWAHLRPFFRHRRHLHRPPHQSHTHHPRHQQPPHRCLYIFLLSQPRCLQGRHYRQPRPTPHPPPKAAPLPQRGLCLPPITRASHCRRLDMGTYGTRPRRQLCAHTRVRPLTPRRRRRHRCHRHIWLHTHTK